MGSIVGNDSINTEADLVFKRAHIIGLFLEFVSNKGKNANTLTIPGMERQYEGYRQTKVSI